MTQLPFIASLLSPPWAPQVKAYKRRCFPCVAPFAFFGSACCCLACRTCCSEDPRPSVWNAWRDFTGKPPLKEGEGPNKGRDNGAKPQAIAAAPAAAPQARESGSKRPAGAKEEPGKEEVPPATAKKGAVGGAADPENPYNEKAPGAKLLLGCLEYSAEMWLGFFEGDVLQLDSKKGREEKSKGARPIGSGASSRLRC